MAHNRNFVPKFYVASLWERLSYKQKKAIYRFATGDSCPASEQLLNLWWFNLSLAERDDIFREIEEFIDKHAN